MDEYAGFWVDEEGSGIDGWEGSGYGDGNGSGGGDGGDVFLIWRGGGCGDDYGNDSVDYFGVGNGYGGDGYGGGSSDNANDHREG